MIASAAALPVRKRDDYAFLPAALEILETPLSPIRGSMMTTICGLVVASLGLGYFGHVDVIAVAQGKIQPVGRTKTVEPLEPGRVRRVVVTDGQLVKAGDLLVSLDPSERDAEAGELGATLQGLKAEQHRRRTALATVAVNADAMTAAIDWPTTTLPAARAREERVLDGDLAQLAGQRASLRARREQAQAESERLRATIAAQDALAAISKQRVDMRSELLQRDAASKASVIDAEEAYQTQVTSLTTAKGQLGESEAAQRLSDRDMDQARTTFLADNAQKLADVERRIEEGEQRLAKAQIRQASMELRSPVDGRVAGLTVTSPGQVVSTGEQIMQIVPAGAQLEVEAYLPNADAGSVQTGQTAVVKVQSFPFTDYGTIEARVTHVADDAVPPTEADQRQQNPVATSRGSSFGGAQAVQNLVFPVTLALDRPSLDSHGTSYPLLPGMSVTVEVRTGSRRILGYLLAPLTEVFATAMRER